MTLPLHHENQQEKKNISKYQDMHIDINHLIMPAIYRWPLSYVENWTAILFFFLTAILVGSRVLIEICTRYQVSNTVRALRLS
jgi:hypothetical protein